MEIIVGESVVLPCQVVSDPVLDVSFSWAFNGQLITNGDGHFELVGVVSDPLFKSQSIKVHQSLIVVLRYKEG